ncbi:hypothetical protein [Sphingomonas rustica]
MPWLAKGVLSAAYWLFVLYLATGLFAGDRLGPDGRIGPSVPPLPPWLFAVAAIALYALLSWLWDRIVLGRR